MGQGASKVSNRDVQPGVRGVPSLTKDVLRIVGVFEWGPLETATPVANYDHFREIFGPGRCLLANYEAGDQGYLHRHDRGDCGYLRHLDR
jgi:hypothetical protein